MKAEKDIVRKEIKQLRNELSADEALRKSGMIAARLWVLPEYLAADVICTYVSYRNEVGTRGIIDRALADGKAVYVPKVYGRDMHFIRICSADELVPGSYGIPEPLSDEVSDPDEGLMIMPGVAFDREGNRVGYGGGYYDRYLAVHTGLTTVALAYDFQLVENICAEPTDRKPLMIVTDTELITVNK